MLELIETTIQVLESSLMSRGGDGGYGKTYASGVVDALVTAGLVQECKSGYSRNDIETLYAYRRQLRGESWTCN